MCFPHNCVKKTFQWPRTCLVSQLLWVHNLLSFSTTCLGNNLFFPEKMWITQKHTATQATLILNRIPMTTDHRAAMALLAIVVTQPIVGITNIRVAQMVLHPWRKVRGRWLSFTIAIVLSIVMVITDRPFVKTGMKVMQILINCFKRLSNEKNFVCLPFMSFVYVCYLHAFQHLFYTKYILLEIKFFWRILWLLSCILDFWPNKTCFKF